MLKVSTILGISLQRGPFLSVSIVIRWVTFILIVITLGIGNLREKVPHLGLTLGKLVLMVQDLVSRLGKLVIPQILNRVRKSIVRD